MTTEEKKLIGEFLGWKVISYNWHDTFDGNEFCKTIGDIKRKYGRYLEYTGRHVDDTNFDYENDWNLLMMLSEQCVIRNEPFLYDDMIYIQLIEESLVNFHKENLFKSIINFIKWYNENVRK